MIKNEDEILVDKNPVLEDLFDMYKKKAPVQIVQKGKFTKKAVATNSDDISREYVEAILNGNVKNLIKLKPVEGKIIKPLYLFLEKEVKIYADVKNLKLKNKIKKDDISHFIDELEKKHLEIKNSVVSSYLKIYLG